jgi:hypothetical protein
MANDPPFATLNHVAGDLGIPSESALLRFGIMCLKLLHDYSKRASDRSLIGAQLSHFGNDGTHHLEQGGQVLHPLVILGIFDFASG